MSEREEFAKRHRKINAFENTTEVLFYLFAVSVGITVIVLLIARFYGNAVITLLSGAVGCFLFRTACHFFVANARNVESIHRRLFEERRGNDATKEYEDEGPRF